jgi:NAD(P)-dependent dehydrogenase (short-subunit alcohol dehydrogenase family)
MSIQHCKAPLPNVPLGINLSFVKLALASQAKVLIADIKLLKEAEDLIRSPDTAGRVAYAKCDICDWDQLNRLPAEVESAFGEGVVADVWVAGAGVFEPNLSSFFADKEDDCYRAMRINAEHPIKLTRIAMRSCLKANKPGVVLIVASGAGVVGFYGSPLYCATKHAVVGFTKSMAQADKDENVKIVSVCPGIVATPLWKGKDAEEVAKQYAYDDEMSLTPEEVANAMKDLIEQGKFGGGSLLEVSKTRGVNQLESNELTQGLGPEAQTWVERCYAPVRDILGEERGAGPGDS